MINKLKVWSKNILIETFVIKDWSGYQIPRTGEYIKIDSNNREIKQIIWDFNNLEIVVIID